MRRFRRRGWAPAFVVAVVCSAAAPAGAFTGPWQAPTDLAAPGANSASPSVAVAPDGTATTAFVRGGGLQVATRPAGGTFGGATDLDTAAAGESISGFPAMAIAPDGTVVVAWVHTYSSTNAVLRASVRSPGGSFSPPANVSAPGQVAGDPDVAVAPNGDAFLAWDTSATPGVWTVQVAVRPAGGAFGGPESVPVSSVDYLYPRIGAGSDGTATLVFARYTGGGIGYVEATVRGAGGGIAPPVAVSGPQNYVGAPDLGVAADGTATAVFTARVAGNSVVHAASRAPGGQWSGAAPLSDGAHNANDPRVAVAADGTALVAWDRFNGQTTVVQARTRPAGGPSFGPVIPLSAGGFNAVQAHPDVAADGTMLVSWLLDDGTKYILQAATRPVGGDFATPVTVSGSVGVFYLYQHATALGPDGSGVAVFGSQIGPGESRVKAALTANPPALGTGPSITGNRAVGSVLRCTGGTFVGASGLDTFWLRGGIEVARATDYTVAAADQGTALTCRLRATNLFGTADATSAPLVIPAGPGTGGPAVAAPAASSGATPAGPVGTAPAGPPVARSLPTIRGRARVGLILRCRPASFTGAGSLTTSWLRGPRTIAGARRTSYRLTRRDVGRVVACRTTATGPGGRASVISLGVLVRR